MFPKFYKDNKSKINFLYTQVLAERFKRDLTLEVQKEIVFTDVDKNKLMLLIREDNSVKHLGRIKSMFRDLNMILRFTATSIINLRKTLNLLLMMRSKKWKKNQKVRRNSKEMIVIILKMIKSSSS
jgi:hypothetical protein